MAVLIVVLQDVVVGLVVTVSALYALKRLLPFGWRIALAKRLAGRVPDAFRIWLAGVAACDACGGVSSRFRGSARQ